MEDRKHTKRLEMEEEERRKRLKIRELKSMKWMERRRMDKLVEEMSYLELGSFEGEWEEHDRLDDWMVEAQEYGVVVDGDEIMVDMDAKANEGDIEVLGRNCDDKKYMDDKMDYEESSIENEESYEVWLAEELKSMNVDEDICELIFGKAQNLVSERSYYGGGTWVIDRWYNPPVNCLGSGENISYSETQIQYDQKSTVCSLPADRIFEITRGDVCSDKNIRKRRGRGQTSSNWCGRSSRRNITHPRRYLTGRRRMISKGGKARSEGGCMTLLGAEVVIRAQESGVPGGKIPLELCSGQVGGFYGCQDTAEVPKVCQGVQGTDHLPEHVLGDGEGRVVVPEGDRGSVEGPDEGGDDGQLQEDASQHVHVQGVGGGRVVAPGGDGGVRNVRGRHDQHHVGQEGVTGGCVPGGEGGEADDVHTRGDGQELQTSSRTTTFQSSIRRKPKPMYFLKKRNIILDGLVQKRLFDFKKQFPNLEENILTPNRKKKLYKQCG